MRISDIEFFLREAWTGILRSGIMSVISMAIITISLIIFGMFMLILFNVNSLVDGLSSKLEIVLYIKDIESIERLQGLKGKVEGISGVKQVLFVSKQTAWQTFQESFHGKVSLDGFLNNNPLPDSYVVKVDDLRMIPVIAEQLAELPEIDDIRYGGELAARVNRFADTIRIGGWGVISLLVLATLLIVVNTIRLTVLARHDEITIMKLVGATDQFIKWPFIIEGIVIGSVGAAISTFILKSSYDLLIPHLQESLPFLPFVYSQAKLQIVYMYVLSAGVFLGFIGGYISVSKSLKNAGTEGIKG
ncbi:MAG: permease-like cell division protein FtsX [Candidatus Margulisiibacteriota bacterium]